MIEGFFASSVELRGGSRPCAGRLRGLASRLAAAEKEKKSSRAGNCHEQSEDRLLESKARSRCSRCIKRKEIFLPNKSKIGATNTSSGSLGCAGRRLGTSGS